MGLMSRARTLPVTDAGREAVRAALDERGRGARAALARHCGIAQPSINLFLEGGTASCDWLEDACVFLKIPLFRVLPLDGGQLRALEALEAVRELAPERVESVLRSIEERAEDIGALKHPRNGSKGPGAPAPLRSPRRPS